MKVEARATRYSDGVWGLIVRCPYCGKRHLHGGGSGDIPHYGNRLSHCPEPPRNYELVPQGGIGHTGEAKLQPRLQN
jgi:hypothetical protein